MPAPIRDVKAVCWHIAHLTARDWYRQQVHTLYTQFYIWYRTPQGEENIAIPLVSATAPDERYTRSVLLSPAWTVERATREIYEAMQTLPILQG